MFSRTSRQPAPVGSDQRVIAMPTCYCLNACAFTDSNPTREDPESSIAGSMRCGGRSVVPPNRLNLAGVDRALLDLAGVMGELNWWLVSLEATAAVGLGLVHGGIGPSDHRLVGIGCIGE